MLLVQLLRVEPFIAELIILSSSGVGGVHGIGLDSGGMGRGHTHRSAMREGAFPLGFDYALGIGALGDGLLVHRAEGFGHAGRLFGFGGVGADGGLGRVTGHLGEVGDSFDEGWTHDWTARCGSECECRYGWAAWGRLSAE